MSRHIPKEISDRLKIRDYFKCIWCGTHLYERHHIVEYQLGGEHTLNNLALLCPNCHTLVHKVGIISPLELLDRFSLQKKGDRIQGRVDYGIEGDTIFHLGNCKVYGGDILLTSQGQPIFKYDISENGELLFSCRLFNQEGDLILWMHDNSFWTTSDFKCEFNYGRLRIESLLDKQFIEIYKDHNEHLVLIGESFLNGKPFTMTPDIIKVGGVSITGNFEFAFGAYLQF